MYANKERLRIQHLTKVLDCIDNVEMKIRGNSDYVKNNNAMSQLIDEALLEVAKGKTVLNRLKNLYFVVLNS